MRLRPNYCQLNDSGLPHMKRKCCHRSLRRELLHRRVCAVRRRKPAARTNSGPLAFPHIVAKDGRYALFVDGAPYLMLGFALHGILQGKTVR